MLAEDNRSCRDYDGYLLYSERTILKSIHLSDETNLNAPIKPFEDPDHMKNVIALSFDYHGGGGKGANRIFFSDIHFGNIQQINDDGTDRKIVVDSKCVVFVFAPWIIECCPSSHAHMYTHLGVINTYQCIFWHSSCRLTSLKAATLREHICLHPAAQTHAHTLLFFLQHHCAF